MNKKLRNHKLPDHNLKFSALLDEITEFSKKWGVEAHEVNVEAEEYSEYGDSYVRMNIYTYTYPDAAEIEADRLAKEAQDEKTRAWKLQQVKKLQKELGIK